MAVREKALEALQNSFDTQRLLAAVDAVDQIRARIDGLRDDLLDLHRMAAEVINEDYDSRPAREEPIWELAEMLASEMLEWYRREYGGEAARQAEAEGSSDWDHLLAAAKAAPPGARGVMFLPHMGGGSCPVVDPRSLGAFVGSGPLTSPSGSRDRPRLRTAPAGPRN